MHRIDTKTAQKDKFGAGKNGFTRGNPQTGTPATDLDDDYFDMLQEELCSVVEASGASLEKGRHDQLLTALRALLLSRKNPFGDIKSDGTVQTALENLGLGEGSALPVGVPVPWPSATPPTGWLKCNGAAFSAEEYRNWQRLIRQINCLIYVVSLFVAGMTGGGLIQVALF
ncbi:Tail Collar domain-containing protein [Escherichia coli]|nr:Tail Collar domain-containing protein [Escherichia coli]